MDHDELVLDYEEDQLEHDYEKEHEQEDITDEVMRNAEQVESIASAAANETRSCKSPIPEGDEGYNAKAAALLSPPKDIKISRQDIEGVHAELSMGPPNTIHYRAVYVHSSEPLGAHRLMKIFAEFRPSEVDSLDACTALVHFNTRADTATMILSMTKPLRRARGIKTAEEGEVMDSDEEEEGQIKHEQGDEVAVVEDAETFHFRRKEDYIEVNVDKAKVPKGKWRVVAEHVPTNSLILLRFPTIDEVDGARAQRHQHELAETTSRKRRINYDDDGYAYKWQGDKTRPGLNIFNEKGEELEWDFEHDTRFYENIKPAEEKRREEAKAEDVAPIAQKKGIKVRGRGSMRGSYLYGSDEKAETLDADSVEVPTKRMRSATTEEEAEKEREDEEDRWTRNHRDPSPTPQPWDRPSGRLANRLTKLADE